MDTTSKNLPLNGLYGEGVDLLTHTTRITYVKPVKKLSLKRGTGNLKLNPGVFKCERNLKL
jgi:hypothetical protein